MFGIAHVPEDKFSDIGDASDSLAKTLLVLQEVTSVREAI